MTESASGIVVVFVAVSLLVAFGVWLGTLSYQHDTFDCTNKCAGAHSVQLNHKCYCEKEP